jgi:hypothetical protein
MGETMNYIQNRTGRVGPGRAWFVAGEVCGDPLKFSAGVCLRGKLFHASQADIALPSFIEESDVPRMSISNEE